MKSLENLPDIYLWQEDSSDEIWDIIFEEEGIIPIENLKKKYEIKLNIKSINKNKIIKNWR